MTVSGRLSYHMEANAMKSKYFSFDRVDCVYWA